jgi:hypothetical protein
MVDRVDVETVWTAGVTSGIAQIGFRTLDDAERSFVPVRATAVH